VTQQSNFGLDRLKFKVPRSHAIIHSDTIGLLWTNDQLVAVSTSHKTHTNTQNEEQCPQWDSNPRSKQSSGSRPMP